MVDKSRVRSRARLATCAAVPLILAAYLGAQAPSPPSGRGIAPPRQGRGPEDNPLVDPASAERGKVIWGPQCARCHGPQARGADGGPNLIRSAMVLRDRYGSQIGPLLKRGHPVPAGAPGADLSDAQIVDLANFLRQRVNDSLRGSPIFQVQNVLTGDPKAGAAYFNGEGNCSRCHSPARNSLAGVSARYEPVDLQQRFLFPGGGRGGRGRAAGPAPGSAVTVTVTPRSGETVTGVLLQSDDFTVALRDASGSYRSFALTPSTKVVINDPLEAHHALLDSISDKNIHDVVAYLETLK
jgi:mono/diheme cytochrome c family protein